MRVFVLLVFCLAQLSGCSGAKRGAHDALRLKPLGETQWKPFSAWKLERRSAPPIDVYVARKPGRRPAILLLPGSKCLPLFWILPRRRISPLFLVGSIPKVLDQAHVVAFDRRGLKSFGPPPSSEKEARKLARCTPTHGGVSKLERVADAVAVAEGLLRQPWVSELWVVGHSEGADVASGVVRRLKGRVAAVGLLAGAGITRFFEKSQIARRRSGSKGALVVLREVIEATRPNPPRRVGGDSLELVLTYGIDSSPLDDLRGLDVPVFVAHGDADRKVPIETADAFVAELLRQRGRALRYVIYSGCDHGFRDAKGSDHSETVLLDFIAWARKREKGRSLAVR